MFQQRDFENTDSLRPQATTTATACAFLASASSTASAQALTLRALVTVLPSIQSGLAEHGLYTSVCFESLSDGMPNFDSAAHGIPFTSIVLLCLDARPRSSDGSAALQLAPWLSQAGRQCRSYFLIAHRASGTE